MWRESLIRRYLWFTLPLPLCFLLYGYSLELPFFLDDGAHFSILAQTSGLEFWGDFPTFPFYRPLVFTIWQAFEGITGGYDPVALHYLNVAIFGVSGVLVGQIARRLMRCTKNAQFAPLAGILFVLFPFSYQAVAMVAALFHLTLVLGVLLCLWAGSIWLDRPHNYTLLVLAWGGAFVSLFSHENGVLTAPLLLGYVFVIYRGALPPFRWLLRLIAPIILLTMVYLWRWLVARPQDATGISEAVDVSFAVLVQGIAYPLMTGVRLVSSAGDAEPISIIVLSLVGVVAGMMLVMRYAPPLMLSAFFGVGWYVLAIIPATLFLTAGYVLGQTRLALFASVGGALFWTIVIACVWNDRWWRRGLALALMLIFIVVSMEFLSMRRTDFMTLARYQAELLASFEVNAVDEASAVVINAPDFLTPHHDDRRFLIGSEGVLFVDPAADYALQYTINSPYDYEHVAVVGYPAIQRNSDFDFSAHPPMLGFEGVVEAVRGMDFVYVTQFNGRDFSGVLVGGEGLPPPERETDVRFDDNVRLSRASARLQSGQYVDVVSEWTIDMPDAIKIFAHVYCNGEFIAQSDGYMWGDTYPLAVWSSGETQTDQRRIYINEAVTHDCLAVYIGLYYEANVTRLQAVDTMTGEHYENDQVPVYIVIEG